MASDHVADEKAEGQFHNANTTSPNREGTLHKKEHLSLAPLPFSFLAS